MAMALRKTDLLEYAVSFSGETQGDLELFQKSLLDGRDLVFQAQCFPGDSGVEQAPENYREAYTCGSVFIAPAQNYFAGLIGPLYAAFQGHDDYGPLHKAGHPMYFYQAADSRGDSCVRHFFTHPGWPPRPSRTGRYAPLRWLSRGSFVLAHHVDDAGRVLFSDMDLLSRAVETGGRVRVLIRRALPEGRGEDLDYWLGVTLDLTYYFPDSDTAAGQSSETVFLWPAVPMDIAGAGVCRLMLDTGGRVAFVVNTVQQPVMARTSETEEQGAELRVHVTEGDLRHRREMKWFVDLPS
jgi:hypothetical protein